MSNRGNGIAILALLIGFGGIGLGVYAIFFMPDTIIQQASGNSEITQIWTVEQSGVFYPTSSFTDMTDMDVTISVNTGETVYVMFNAQVSDGASGGTGWLTGGVRVMRDNVAIDKSVRTFIFNSVVGISVNS